MVCSDGDRQVLHLTQMMMLMVTLMVTIMMLMVMLMVTMMLLMVMLTCWHSISDLRNSKL